MAGEIELSAAVDAEEQHRPSASNIVGGLLGWAARAGKDLAGTGMGIVRELPGGAELERQVHGVEKAVASGVRQWVDSVDERERRHEQADEEPAEQTASDLPAVPDTLRETMSELLFRSATSRREDAREYLYASILRLIVPDEARILAGLSDGAAYPVVHVAERSGITGTSRFVLRNGSTVGRAVGTALHEEVPNYLARLQTLGLIEIGAALEGLDDQYEILQTESRVREALQSAKSARIVRRSVRISDLGARFWKRCDPAALPDPGTDINAE
ncbi:Abi-alpha family protein [Saccharopolyspora griseoalba]|uniref:Abi-alpha family protein n=1 Tax=Saccharopolyspora griseoalba TaxID=1431848 RepID=A0ABW2LF34_9PSEU